MANSNAPISELDFQKIKRDLINYIRSNPTFTDYDFEGSALNTLIDILAYNTHYNAFYANMMHNESFLDTAQKRTSVSSKAKQYGYVPRSATASTALVDIQVITNRDITDTIILPRGEIATAKNENGSFSFLVVDDVIMTKEENGYFFRDVLLKEGTFLSNVYNVDYANNPQGLYTIPNQNVDISSLKVFVRDSFGSLNVAEYFIENDVDKISSDSNVYFIQESYSGLYQIYFGDSVIGKKLESGSEITIYYVATNKEVANGCKLFTFNEIVPDTDNLVITLAQSTGGKERESVEEIKESIQKSFTAQNRAVTPNDYVSILKNNFSFINNASVWGGEDAIPPQYGKVFISLQSERDALITSRVKNDVIIPTLKKFSVLTVIPEIIDPQFTFIRLSLDIKFNKNKTVSTVSNINAKIIAAIQQYFDTKLNTFNKDLIASQLTSAVLAADDGIIGCNISLQNSFKINPTLGIRSTYNIIESNMIQEGSIISTSFKTFIDGVEKIVKIVDDPSRKFVKPDINGKNKQFGVLTLIDETNKQLIDIGSILYSNDTNSTSGVFEFFIDVSNFVSVSDIRVYYKTQSEDVSSSRNQIVLLDTSIANPAIGSFNGIDIKLTTYEK